MEATARALGIERSPLRAVTRPRARSTRSAEVDDHDAALVLWLATGRSLFARQGQRKLFDDGGIPSLVAFFSPTNLVDDEGGQHRSALNTFRFFDEDNPLVTVSNSLGHNLFLTPTMHALPRDVQNFGCYAPAVRRAARLAGVLGMALAASLVLSTRPSAAQLAGPSEDDFAFEGDAWNSVSQMTRIAVTRHQATQIPSRLDVGALDPSDSIMILSPRRELPVRALIQFLGAGGRVILADDFARGSELLRAFHIDRMAPRRAISSRLRGNPELLVARATEPHPLSEGVRALVTNHPQVVAHRELRPVFELAPGEALVLAGAVGAGRLVVLSDPSVLIDNMLTLEDHRRFAENLIDYAQDGVGGRLFLVGPNTPIVGRYGDPGADRPLHDLRSTLERLAGLELPPPAVRVMGLTISLIAFLMALGALPWRSPYRLETMFPEQVGEGGFLGRVRFFGKRGRNLLSPALTYRRELEKALREQLSIDEGAGEQAILAALGTRGLAAGAIAEARTLLRELAALQEGSDGPTPPRVTSGRLRRLIGRGERLLQLIAPPGDATR